MASGTMPSALVSHQGHPIGGGQPVALRRVPGPHRYAISPGSGHRANPGGTLQVQAARAAAAA